MKKDLSSAMKNVLDAIKYQTIKLKAPNRGQVKARVSGECYYQNTLDALERRGLVEFRWGGVMGTGYCATLKSLDY